MTWGYVGFAAVAALGVGVLIDSLDVVVLFNAQAAVYLGCGILSYVLILRPCSAVEPVEPP